VVYEGEASVNCSTLKSVWREVCQCCFQQLASTMSKTTPNFLGSVVITNWKRHLWEYVSFHFHCRWVAMGSYSSEIRQLPAVPHCFRDHMTWTALWLPTGPTSACLEVLELYHMKSIHQIPVQPCWVQFTASSIKRSITGLLGLGCWWLNGEVYHSQDLVQAW